MDNLILQNSLIAFIVMIFSYIIIFLIFHIVVIRYITVKKFNTTLQICNILVGILIAVVSLLLLKDYFPTEDLHQLMTLIAISWGMGLCALYSLLGASMADRSLTAAMLMKLYNAHDNKMPESEICQSLEKKIFDKRIAEHQEISVVNVYNNIVKLTPKGRKIAKAYLFLLKLLRLNDPY